jgi:hypothetical protein
VNIVHIDAKCDLDASHQGELRKAHISAATVRVAGTAAVDAAARGAHTATWTARLSAPETTSA